MKFFSAVAVLIFLGHGSALIAPTGTTNDGNAKQVLVKRFFEFLFPNPTQVATLQTTVKRCNDITPQQCVFDSDGNVVDVIPVTDPPRK